jgi:hypothetical protein
VQRPELRGESYLLLRRERLIPEEQHLVLHEQFAEPIDVLLRQFLRQIEPLEESADSGGHARYLNSHIRILP